MLPSEDQQINGYKKGGKLTLYILEIFALCIIAASLWLPRRISLNRVVTPDEVLWISRSGRFKLALEQDVYAKTYQKEHPGVTLMWVGAAAYENLFQEYILNKLSELIIKNEEMIKNWQKNVYKYKSMVNKINSELKNN